jgi:hypothetical protein
MLTSAGRTSSHLRVFNPQSGLIQIWASESRARASLSRKSAASCARRPNWKRPAGGTPCRAASSASTQRCARATCTSSPTAAAQLGLARVFDETENPFPWMSDAMDLNKEENFFETRVIEYLNGGALSWE